MYWFPHTSQTTPTPTPARRPDKGVVPCRISGSWSDNAAVRCTTQTLGIELESSGLEDQEAHLAAQLSPAPMPSLYLENTGT